MRRAFRAGSLGSLRILRPSLARAEKRFVVGVEAESLVAEEAAEVKKITRAAAKIENVQWWGAIEPKILGALNVDPDPVTSVFVRIDFPRIWPIRITVPQPF